MAERAFKPETQARREREAAKQARWRGALDDALAKQGTPPPARGVLDAGTELALAKSAAAVEAGRPLKPSEHRAVRRETLAQAGRSARKTPSIDEYLESLSQRQRETIEASGWFQKLDRRHQADVRRRLAVLEEIEEAAEYEFQQWKEEQSLANIDDGSWHRDVDEGEQTVDEYGQEWPADFTEAERQAGRDLSAFEQSRVDQLERDADAASADWYAVATREDVLAAEHAADEAIAEEEEE